MLVFVNRDGSDGQRMDLSEDMVDVGRSEGRITFPNDTLLAARHARLFAVDGKLKLQALDALNGVFVRLRAPEDLQSGDLILVGRELVRFEIIATEERDPPSFMQHGMRMFGTVARESWARLRQLTQSGATRDLWHLSRAETVLGREEGDLIFPDDEFMSRRHAMIRRNGERGGILEDLGSSNGTFLRLRSGQERTLESGDLMRMGDQLLRFER